MKKLKLYLDCCCYYRFLDDHSQERVRIEYEAVMTILRKKEMGAWDILSSDVLDEEILKTPNPIKKLQAMKLYTHTEHIEISDEIVMRANTLQTVYGMAAFDALHLASAENGKSDVLLTTDRKFISKALDSDTMLRVANPAIWLMEVLFDEY